MQYKLHFALPLSQTLDKPVKSKKKLSFFFPPIELIRRSIRSHIIIYFRIISLMSSMSLHSLNLPGVGTKYEFETDKGDTVAIFFTKTGTIQMYTLQKGCKTPSAAEMTPVEARRLGNILTGAIIEADQESVEIAFSALADLRVTIHSFLIPKSISGRTIEELQIRAKTGATVIAVCRHDRNIINPPPAFVFETGDAALVIGESDQIRMFEREIMVD
jgi:TrkA domain protein